MSVVLTEFADGVAVFTLNRPEAKNAVNLEVSKALAAALDEFEALATWLRAVLTGHAEVGGFTHVQVLPCGDLRLPAQGSPAPWRSGPEAGTHEGTGRKICEADQRRREIICFGPARGSPEWAATP